MLGVKNSKEEIPSRVQPVLESVASLYREALGSLQAPAITMPRTPSRALLSAITILAALISSSPAFAAADDENCPHTCKETITIVPPNLEITRPVRTWEFLSATGTQAGIFGNESGRVEAWVYPLKILRDLHLRFNTGERILNAELWHARSPCAPNPPPSSTPATLSPSAKRFSFRRKNTAPSSPSRSKPNSLSKSKPLHPRLRSSNGPPAIGATFTNGTATSTRSTSAKKPKVFRFRRLAHRP